jgi:hypothetical protein
MIRFSSLAFALLMAASWCYGQDSAAAAPAGSANVVGHGAFPVTLKKALDSSKLKEGDPVEVETSGAFKLADGTLVAKGTKVAGHVTEAKARSKGDAQSELAITFDKVNIVGGKQVSVKGMVQAVSPPADEPEPIMFGGKASGAAGGGYGASNATVATVGTVTNGTSGSNTDSGKQAQVATNPQASGVQGMHDLQLSPEGVLSSSKGKQVKLGSEVRMIVHVDILE